MAVVVKVVAVEFGIAGKANNCQEHSAGRIQNRPAHPASGLPNQILRVLPGLPTLHSDLPDQHRRGRRSYHFRKILRHPSWAVAALPTGSNPGTLPQLFEQHTNRIFAGFLQTVVVPREARVRDQSKLLLHRTIPNPQVAASMQKDPESLHVVVDYTSFLASGTEKEALAAWDRTAPAAMVDRRDQRQGERAGAVVRVGDLKKGATNAQLAKPKGQVKTRKKPKHKPGCKCGAGMRPSLPSGTNSGYISFGIAISANEGSDEGVFKSELSSFE